jgi:hypothetical protein
MLIVAAIGFVALLVVGVLITVFSAVGWFLWLPFKVIGWALKLLGLVIAAPFILLALVLGGFATLLGVGFVFIPLFPLLLLGGLAWWMFGRRPTSHAKVVS